MSELKDNSYPLVLIFYLDREMMKHKEILNHFVDAVNSLINSKEYNVMAFFLPTDGEERVECINPIVTPQAEMDKIQRIINHIKKEFSIGEEFDNVTDV